MGNMTSKKTDEAKNLQGSPRVRKPRTILAVVGPHGKGQTFYYNPDSGIASVFDAGFRHGRINYPLPVYARPGDVVVFALATSAEKYMTKASTLAHASVEALRYRLAYSFDHISDEEILDTLEYDSLFAHSHAGKTFAIGKVAEMSTGSGEYRVAIIEDLRPFDAIRIPTISDGVACDLPLTYTVISSSDIIARFNEKVQSAKEVMDNEAPLLGTDTASAPSDNVKKAA